MPHVVALSAVTPADRALLGNKGAGLARMLSCGVPVPPAFVITTEVCRSFLRDGLLPEGLEVEIDAALSHLEHMRGLHLGDPHAPLLVSVRSGAAVSMPGMMDTVLDLGVTDATRCGLAARSGTRFALDSHRRFLVSFGTVVLGIAQGEFDTADERVRDSAGGQDQLDERVLAYRRILTRHVDDALLEDPRAQLSRAIRAVFGSWNSARAASYRSLHSIPDDLGTAVVVQCMVFGNLNERSGTGVVFTRNPNTGERGLYGDFLPRAQGEDVVAGRHRTLPVAALAAQLPQVWDELGAILAKLERECGEMLDVEFTVEDDTLYILQMRAGKRAAPAAVRIAVEMANEGVISRTEAVRRVSAAHLQRLQRPHVDPDAGAAIATGLGASPGVATGVVCLSADRVSECADQGCGVVLVRRETAPADVHGMAAADGILTSLGGLVSHAAVVARDLGVPAVVGVQEMVVDEEGDCITIAELVLKEGDLITIDGGSGEVYAGSVTLVQPRPCAELDTLLGWADEISATTRAHLPAGSAAARLAAAHGSIAG